MPSPYLDLSLVSLQSRLVKSLRSALASEAALKEKLMKMSDENERLKDMAGTAEELHCHEARI